MEDRPLLLAFSHLRWDFVFQRPQHLLTRAAEQFDVLFWEEPLPAAAGQADLRLRQPRPGLTIATPMLAPAVGTEQLVGMLDTLLSQFRKPHQDLLLWYYTPMALAFSGHLQPRLCVYDCMDELSAFRGAPPGLLQAEASLLQRADLVFTGGRSLFNAKRGRHAAVHCFPSAVDAAHFGAARRGLPQPSDHDTIPRPRLGFFGVIDERMDLELLSQMAGLRPGWHFVMVGPVAKIDPAALPQAPNIHWLGGRDYADLPSYLAQWELGFMPFAINDSTRFISPTKTPEFLAAGLPLLSSPVEDVVEDWGRQGLVRIAGTAPEMVAAAEELLAADRTGWLHAVDARLAMLSWDATWQGMLRLMQQAAPAPGLRAAARVPGHV